MDGKRSKGRVMSMEKTLLSLGAHIGHVYLDTSDSLGFYVLGKRNFFTIIDVRKTIVLLKKAVLFYEQLVYRYGHAVFCHSGISAFGIELRHFFTRIATERGQSFSYWRWAPGCVTNYRSVFLRLVTALFKDISRRVYYDRLDCIRSAYDISANRSISRAWWIFKKKNGITADSDKMLEAKFSSFFTKYKAVMLRKYLSRIGLARRRFRLKHSAFDVAKQARQYSHINGLVGKPRKRKQRWSMHWAGDGYTRQRVLPTFASLLLRMFYVIQHSGAELLRNREKRHGTSEEHYNALYKRMLVFWRAIIFFRFFKKTANLPDCLVLLNPDNKTAEFNDFVGVRLPIIGIADTNTDISMLTYPIPSNDDSLVLSIFYFMIFANACETACVDRYRDLY